MHNTFPKHISIQTATDAPIGITMYVSPTLPDEFKNVVMQDDYTKHGDYSVTELLDDPRCARLRQMYPDLTATVDELLHSTFGRALHKYFEERLSSPHPDTHLETEYSLELTIDNHVISGTCDELLINDDALLIGDIKNWTVFHYMADEWSDLFWQLQIYNFMYTTTQQKERSKNWVRGIIFFKDWNRRDAAIHKDKYPPSKGVAVNFQALPSQQVAQFLRTRLNLHLNLEHLPEAEWPDAAAHKVWQKMEAYRIYKLDEYKDPEKKPRAVKGGAFKVSDYDSPNHAHAQAILKLKEAGEASHVLVPCWSPRKRCESYCPVSEKCSAWRAYRKQNPSPTHNKAKV